MAQFLERFAAPRLKYCRPGLREQDIPHRNTLRTEILKRAQLAVDKVRQRLRDLPGKVSFTFDAWTSEPGDPYLVVWYRDTMILGYERWKGEEARGRQPRASLIILMDVSREAIVPEPAAADGPIS